MKKLVLVTVFVWIIALLVLPAKAQQKPVTKKPVAAKPTAVASRKVAAKPTVAKATPAKPVAEAKPAVENTPNPAVSQPTDVQQTAPTTTPGRQTTAARRAPRRSVSGRTKYLNVGLGLGAYVYSGVPLGASFEVELKDNISVGGSFDFNNYGGYTAMYFGARGSYHLGELLNASSKFDPYVGVTIGGRRSGYGSSYDYGYNSYGNGIYFGGHLGARYMFGEKVGGFAEVGYGVAALRLGVTAKF